MKRRITNGKPTPGTLFYRLKQFSRNEMKPGLSCHLKSGRYVTPWGFASHTIRVATPTKSVKLSVLLELHDVSDDTHVANRGRYVTSVAEAQSIIDDYNFFNEDLKFYFVRYMHEHKDARGRDIRSKLNNIVISRGLNTRTISTPRAPYGTGSYRQIVTRLKEIRDTNDLPF